MFHPKTFKKIKKSDGISPILINLAVVVAALLIAVALPSTEKVQAWSIGIFLAIAAVGGVVFGIAALLNRILRKKHVLSKSSPVLDWTARIGVMLLTAGLIAIFYSAILK